MYWWAAQKNFGDLLGPDIVSKVSGRDTTRGEIGSCELVSQGSVLGFILDSEDLIRELLHVWGSGFIRPRVPITNPYVKFHAVRGRWTAYIQGLSNPVLGDLGLLVS
jgi:hypothetical protein